MAAAPSSSAARNDATPGIPYVRRRLLIVSLAVFLGAAAAIVQLADLAFDLGMWDETLAWILGGGALATGCLAASLAVEHAPRTRRAWRLWAAGGLLVVAGAAAAAGSILARGSVPHALYLPWLGFAICGIVGLAFLSSPGTLSFPLFLLDAIPLVLAAVAFIRPNGTRVEWGGVSGELAALAFPALFVLLVLVAMELVLLERHQPYDGLSLTAIGFATMAVACIVWVSPSKGSFAHGQWADSLWTIGVLLVAAAGCRSAFAIEDAGESSLRAGDSGARVFLPLAGVAALGLMLIKQYGRYHALVWATIAAVVILAARFIISRRAAELALERERSLRVEVEQARAQIAEQNEQLRELDRIKDALIASVSHELRTPLTAIRGYLQIVTAEESGALNPEQHQLLAIVSRNAERLGRIINDLLFVAQSDAGKLTLEKTEVDLCEIAADAVAAARPAANAKRIRLSHQGDTTQLVADRGRLSQITDNLISNAIKFTPDGGSVHVESSVENGAAVLSVRDTGIGMTPAEQQRLFERFYRTDTATEQAIPGTGLGLSIVKAIVDAHAGTITVESHKDKGTTFRVALPKNPI